MPSGLPSDPAYGADYKFLPASLTLPFPGALASNPPNAGAMANNLPVAEIVIGFSGTIVRQFEQDWYHHVHLLPAKIALGNLLSNALRYGAPHSTVDIRIQQEAEALTLSVCNSGETIAPEHLPRLFDRFYRVDRSRQRPDAEGSGLGLAICQAIVQAHGGEIDVQSADGRTCFSARFAQRPHSPA